MNEAGERSFHFFFAAFFFAILLPFGFLLAAFLAFLGAVFVADAFFPPKMAL